MRAIITKYHGPTNRHGSRISADDGSNRIYVPYNDGFNDPYRVAALALCRKMKYAGKLVCGYQESGRVFVFVPQSTVFAQERIWDMANSEWVMGPSSNVLDLSMSDADIEKQSSM